MRVTLVAILSILLSGCSSLSYLWQAGRGQLELVNRARPLEEVINDERTSPKLRELLMRVSAIKRFGESQGLKATKNYDAFVQLNRPAAVWVVSASAPLRFQPQVWEFPIVGSFTYLGWFDRKDADRYAAQIASEGLDVDVRGARAYSTLGWFKDSILSSMIPSGEDALGQVAEVILHESVHSTVYVHGQSWFNESLADFVARRLTPEYLKSVTGSASHELAAYQQEQLDGVRYQESMHEAYEQLSAIYATSLSDEQKKAQKSLLLQQLKDRLGINHVLNNASLIQFKTYGSATQEFEGLLKACGSNYSRFLNRVGRLTESDFGGPQREVFGPLLIAAAKSGC